MMVLVVMLTLMVMMVTMVIVMMMLMMIKVKLSFLCPWSASDIDQLKKTMKLTGTPNQELLAKITSDEVP